MDGWTDSRTDLLIHRGTLSLQHFIELNARTFKCSKLDWSNISRQSVQKIAFKTQPIWLNFFWLVSSIF